MIQANPRFCELTGYSEAELAALAPAELTHPEDAANDEALTGAAGARRDPDVPPPQALPAPQDGEVVWVRATVTLLRDADGQPRRIVGVVEDITEHLRAARRPSGRARRPRRRTARRASSSRA